MANNWTEPSIGEFDFVKQNIKEYEYVFVADESTGDIEDVVVGIRGFLTHFEYIPGSTPSVAGVTPTLKTPNGSTLNIGGSALTDATLVTETGGKLAIPIPAGFTLSCTNATALAEGTFIFGVLP